MSSLCGDVRLDPGEDCDFGPANAAPESCCDALCRFAPATQVCRPAAGECDQSESCSGEVAGCPADLGRAAGAVCTPDNDLCTDDRCDGAGACAHPLRPGTVCEENQCTCDDDDLFCNGLVQCQRGGGLCLVLPTPCAEDDVCDEVDDVCVSPLGTVTASPTATATASRTNPDPTATTTPIAPSPTAPGTPTQAATPSAGVTGVPSATPSSTPTVSAPAPGTATTTPTDAPICAGDCNGDGAVAVNELVLGVSIALGNQPASACPPFDSNGDGAVAIAELIAAVGNALRDCQR